MTLDGERVYLSTGGPAVALTEDETLLVAADEGLVSMMLTNRKDGRALDLALPQDAIASVRRGAIGWAVRLPDVLWLKRGEMGRPSFPSGVASGNAEFALYNDVEFKGIFRPDGSGDLDAILARARKWAAEPDASPWAELLAVLREGTRRRAGSTGSWKRPGPRVAREISSFRLALTRPLSAGGCALGQLARRPSREP